MAAEGGKGSGGGIFINLVKAGIVKMLARRVLQTEGLDYRTMKVSHLANRATKDKNERYQAIKMGIEKLREMKQRMEDERR